MSARRLHTAELLLAGAVALMAYALISGRRFIAGEWKQHEKWVVAEPWR